MKNLFVNWCKIMFTQNNGAVCVRTATCQSGALRAHGQVFPAAQEEFVSGESLFAQTPLVELQENIVYLNRREFSFVNKEAKRLLKNRRVETARKRKEGIPLPPEPGKIAYAVYQ